MKIFKKVSILILIALLLISSIVATTGCTAKTAEDQMAVENQTFENVESNESEVIEDTEVAETKVMENAKASDSEIVNNSGNNAEKNTNEEKTEETIEDIILEILDIQEDSIVSNNRISYMNTLSSRDPVLQSDSNAWFYLLTKGDLKDFSIELVEVLSREENEAVALVHLKYMVDENQYDLTYPMKFENNSNNWLSLGPAYKELRNDNIRLLYFEKDEKYARMVMDEAIKSYKTVLDNFNLEDSVDIVIKYYDNYDWLRQFAYPTYKRTFMAWAAGGGNISLTHNQKAKNDEDIKASFRGTLLHEFTHEISYEMTNHGAFPRWLFEGLGEYYGGPPLYSTDYGELRLWTIEELDSDKFMELTDKKEVRSYYASSAKLVSYLLDNYGKDKLILLLNSIGESSLSNDKWMERFIEVFEVTYGITYDEFKDDWSRFIESQ